MHSGALDRRIALSGGVDVNPSVQELIVLSSLAAFCCIVAWTFNEDILAAVFAIEGIIALLAAISQSWWPR